MNLFDKYLDKDALQVDNVRLAQSGEAHNVIARFRLTISNSIVCDNMKLTTTTIRFPENYNHIYIPEIVKRRVTLMVMKVLNDRTDDAGVHLRYRDNNMIIMDGAAEVDEDVFTVVSTPSGYQENPALTMESLRELRRRMNNNNDTLDDVRLFAQWVSNYSPTREEEPEVVDNAATEPDGGWQVEEEDVIDNARRQRQADEDRQQAIEESMRLQTQEEYTIEQLVEEDER